MKFTGTILSGFLAAAASLITSSGVSAHSQPSCTQKTSDTSCAGFPRYYHFNHLPIPQPTSGNGNTFYASRDREFLVPEFSTATCPQLVSVPEYTTAFPMARAKAGEQLVLQHPPRGHANQEPGSQVFVYMHPTVDLYPGVLQPPRSEMQLIGQFDYAGNCVGTQQEVSWANCTGSVQLPEVSTSGTYTFWWRWDLNKIPYADCFEVYIEAGNGSTIGSLTAKASVSSKPASTSTSKSSATSITRNPHEPVTTLPVKPTAAPKAVAHEDDPNHLRAHLPTYNRRLRRRALF
ncbi:hypothetical protein HK102_011420 [Quaeritorhiza haematococci]|nr:hypothetical protein HK102_011420 [Quaeritorhiza haematococci]